MYYGSKKRRGKHTAIRYDGKSEAERVAEYLKTMEEMKKEEKENMELQDKIGHYLTPCIILPTLAVLLYFAYAILGILWNLLYGICNNW